MGFSDRLKKLREEKGISQDRLADKLNIDRTSINHYENSENGRTPRPKRLYQIAEYFNVSVDYLLDLSDDRGTTESEEKIIQDTQELTVDELKEKYRLTVDGEPATDDEINAAKAFIRSLRGMK